MEELKIYIETLLAGNKDNVVCNLYDEGYTEGYEDALKDVLEHIG